MTISCEPARDAERHFDPAFAEQRAYEAKLSEAIKHAPRILRAQLQALKRPSDWFKDMVNARGLRSFDDLLCEAIGEDDATNNAIAELLISAAALQVQEAVIAFAASKYPMDIYEGATARH